MKFDLWDAAATERKGFYREIKRRGRWGVGEVVAEAGVALLRVSAAMAARSSAKGTRGTDAMALRRDAKDRRGMDTRPDLRPRLRRRRTIKPPEIPK